MSKIDDAPYDLFKQALTAAFATFDYDDISTRLEKAGVTHGPVQPMAAVLEDEQLRLNGVIVETEDEGEGYPLTIGSPINVAEAPKKKPSRAPELGADTLAVLRELDFDEGYLTELVSQQIIFDGEAS